MQSEEKRRAIWYWQKWHEMLHYATGARTPVVLANVNRAAAALWSDQTDSLSQRETGWIQLYCEGNQEVLDTMIMAFKIAESVRLPAMVILDAFFLSHTSEPVDIPNKEAVQNFLPAYDPADMWLDPDHPRSFGSIAMNDVYKVARKEVWIISVLWAGQAMEGHTILEFRPFLVLLRG